MPHARRLAHRKNRVSGRAEIDYAVAERARPDAEVIEERAEDQQDRHHRDRVDAAADRHQPPSMVSRSGQDWTYLVTTTSQATTMAALSVTVALYHQMVSPAGARRDARDVPGVPGVPGVLAAAACGVPVARGSALSAIRDCAAGRQP